MVAVRSSLAMDTGFMDVACILPAPAVLWIRMVSLECLGPSGPSHILRLGIRRADSVRQPEPDAYDRDHV